MVLFAALAGCGAANQPADHGSEVIFDAGADIRADVLVGDLAGRDAAGDTIADGVVVDVGDGGTGSDVDDVFDDTPDPDASLNIPDFGDVPFVPGDDCPIECPAGTGCRGGRCVGGIIQVNLDNAASITGVFVTPDGVGTGFVAVLDGANAARASFDLSGAGGPLLDVVVSTSSMLDSPVVQSSSISWTDELGSYAISGNGTLDGLQAQALARLGAGPVGHVLAQVPLEIGCLGGIPPDPLLIQALLTPSQFMAKYVYPDRVSRALEAASKVSCTYPALTDSAWTSASTTVRLSRESPVPSVYGLLPFDDVGSVEQELPDAMRAPGSAYGPCGALCRGACGADCDDTACTVTATGYECMKDETTMLNNGMRQEIQEVSCGTAQGCRDHDDCYDLCNGALGCGTWDAAYCRRDCDIEACWKHGYETCTHWAQGAGPQDADLLTYNYPTPGSVPYEDQVNCPDLDHMMGQCWWHMQGMCGDNVCSSLDYCADMMKLDCTPESLAGAFSLTDPYDQFVVNYFSAGSSCPD